MKKVVLGLAIVFGAWACEDSNAVYVEHLAIVNINPSHGAVGIGYTTDLTVTFSDVLDITTVTTASICLTKDSDPPPEPTNPCATGTPIASTPTYILDTLSAKLVPAEPLLPDERYTLHLTTAIKGVKSGALPANVSASFTTIPTS